MGEKAFKEVVGIEINWTPGSKSLKFIASEEALDAAVEILRKKSLAETKNSEIALKFTDKQKASVHFLPLRGIPLEISIEKEGQRLPIVTLSKEYFHDAVQKLAWTSSKQINNMRWMTRTCSGIDLYELPYVEVKFVTFFLNAYLLRFHQSFSPDARYFFDFPIGYGLNRVLAAEIAPADQGQKVCLKVFLDGNITAAELRALEYLLNRIPAYSEFSQDQSFMGCIDSNWVIKSSPTSTAIPVPTTENALQELYEKGLFGKDIAKATAIFECPGREPQCKTKKQPFAISLKIPYDPFMKAHLIHAMMNDCLRYKWPLNGYFYKVVIKSNEKEHAIQIIWIFGNEINNMKEEKARENMDGVATRLRPWIKLLLQTFPTPPILITINPYQLKNEKPVKNLPHLIKDHSLSGFVDTSVSFDKSGLARPVQKMQMIESVDERPMKQIEAPKAAAKLPAPESEHIVSESLVSECKVEEEKLLVESPIANIVLVSEFDSLLGKNYQLRVHTKEGSWLLIGSYDILKYYTYQSIHLMI